MFEKTNIVSKILYLNIIVFLLMIINPTLIELFAIYPFSSEKFHLYQFLTSMFTHGGVFHIMFNMFALLSFGPECEKFLGEKRFAIFYIISGIFGAFLQLMFEDVPLVGASAAIFGLIILFAFLNPNTKLSIIFFPFISFKAKNIILAILAFEIFAIFNIKGDGIAHIAHIGGAIVGVITSIYYKYFRDRW
jgi:membrane associated rhomboid family serine protease